MASVDPAAYGTPDAVDAAVARELAALASNAQALRGELHDGAVVTAQVLPPNGLTDVVEILGRRVAASLPPNLTPGDMIVVSVSGFEDDRILLQNLGAAAASELPPVPGAPGVAVSTIAAETASPAGAPPEGATASASPAAHAPLPATTYAPPSLASSYVPQPPSGFAGAAAHSPAAGSSTLPAPAGQPVTLPLSTASYAPPGPCPAGATGSPAPPPSQALFVEAAIRAGVTARAAVPATATPGPASPSTPAVPAASAPAASSSPAPRGTVDASLLARQAALSPRSAVPSALPAERLVASRTLDSAAPRSFVVPPQIVARGTPPAVAPAETATAVQPSPASFRDAGRVASALGLPGTSETVDALRSGLEDPSRLLAALRSLDDALATVPGDDPRVATVRTIVAFATSLDPKSPTFPAALSALVSHVVDGGEPKLAALLSALRAGDDPVAAASARLALDHDLKTNLLELLARPPGEAGAAFPRAAAAALGAITGTQLAVNARPSADPMTFAIPLPFAAAGTAAEIRLHRDGTPANVPLDPDTFHLGFVLTTEHLGTVAIDLRTAQRAVSVEVLAENALSARAFGEGFAGLTQRLEALRYRVASLDAGVAPDRAAAPPETEPDPAPLDLAALGEPVSRRLDIHI